MMNPGSEDVTSKRFHHESHGQVRTHLAGFMAAHNISAGTRTLSLATPHDFIARTWTSGPEQFIVDPIRHMPGLNAKHEPPLIDEG
jgi:hypothetical protein